MSPAMNTTSSLAGGMALTNFGSWFSIVVIVGLCAIVLSVFMMALSGLKGYKITRRWVLWLISSVKYFFFGIGALLSLAVPGLIIYYFGRQASQGNTAPLKITLYIILGYFAISFIGWIASKIINRFRKLEKRIKKEAKKYETFNEKAILFS